MTRTVYVSDRILPDVKDTLVDELNSISINTICLVYGLTYELDDMYNINLYSLEEVTIYDDIDRWIPVAEWDEDEQRWKKVI